ncbi:MULTISPECIES: glycosyltransferase family 4 protein [unclassified Minwuia]|uniref:glycosyltransferase family 4 protein n=1 Tax=unclassified Minwuia TaxID=2618799 RepID=UPI00247895A0|nr:MULTISPECIES: glycosyltransferase family 4 protein [unclassified Minwuia]
MTAQSDKSAEPVRTRSGGKPRVLLVGPFPPTTGGVTTFMLNLMGSDLAERFEFVPHTTSRPPKKNVVDNYGYAAILKGGVLRLFIAAFATLWHLVSFPFVLWFRRIDIVQIQSSDFQTFWESCVYLWMAKRLGRLTMMRLGGIFDQFYEGSSPRMQRGIRAGVASPDILIVQSEGWRDYLTGLGRTGPMLILYNSVPRSSVVSLDQARNEIPLFIFAAGTEGKRKGAYVLIEALQRPDMADIAAELHLAAIIEPLESQFATAALPQRITREGYLAHADLLQRMRSGDVFLMPSYGEGFPNSLLEAMAAGLAPVVTPVGAVPEIVTDGKDGLVIPAGDADALAGAIRRLVDDPALRLQLARSAQERVRQTFVAEVVLERLAAAYLELLARKA